MVVWFLLYFGHSYDQEDFHDFYLAERQGSKRAGTVTKPNLFNYVPLSGDGMVCLWKHIHLW